MDLIALSRLGGRHLVTCICCSTPQCHPQRRAPLHHPSTVSKTLNQLRELLGINCSTARAIQLLLTPFAERPADAAPPAGELNGLTSQEGCPRQLAGGLNPAMRRAA